MRTSMRDATFSLGTLARSLEVCGVEVEQALEGARHVEEILRESGTTEIDHLALRSVIYRCLREHCSVEAADAYLSWRRFRNSRTPLILLVGGAPGSGKSCVSSELAFRLDVVRPPSADTMREVIRRYLTPRAAPTLSSSSLDGWRGLPASATADPSIMAGFLSQLGALQAAVEAGIGRAARERYDLVVDGVHVIPARLDLTEVRKKAIVIPVMLAVMTKKRLEQHLARRRHDPPEREPSAYLERLDDIWRLQSYLVALAQKSGVPVIDNWGIGSTVREILSLVMERVCAGYAPGAYAPA